MKSFKDNQGQQWNLALTLGKVRTLREKLGLDLLNPQHYLQILGSLTDRLAFVFLLVEPQANDIGIDVDEFEERLYGDGFATEAGTAFLLETELFFQKLGQKAMAGLAKSSIKSMAAGQAKLDEMLTSGQFDSLLNQAQGEIDRLMQLSGGNGSPNSEQSRA